MRRGSIVQLVVIGLLSGAIATAIAVLVPWMPTTATKQAERIEFTYWFATVISLFVFAVVAAVLIYSMINFRAEPGDWSDGPPVHGHTTLEIVWTMIPAILVIAIGIVSAIVLAQNSNAGSNPLKIDVIAQQFAWQFTYANGKTYPGPPRYRSTGGSSSTSPPTTCSIRSGCRSSPRSRTRCRAQTNAS